MEHESAPVMEQPAGGQASFGQIPPPQFARSTEIDPDNPPWGVVAGVLTWVASVALLFIVGLAILIVYAALNCKGCDAEELRRFLTTDKTSVFLQIFSALPVHLLTLFVVWAVVTRFGKRPFWKTLGWSWSARVGPWKTLAYAAALFLVGYVIGKFIKGGETDLDQIVNSSLQSRYMLAFVATFTAPLAEEMVYRGVLYSALHKAAGMSWAIAITTLLFALVHVLEYRNNIGAILAISVLSFGLTFLRAYSGRLLPCYIVHLIFNGVTSIYIILEPYLPKSAPDLEQKTPAISMLWRSLRHLLS